MKCNRIKRALIRKTEPNPVANPCGTPVRAALRVCPSLSLPLSRFVCFFMARHRVLFSLCFHNRVQIRPEHGNGQMDIKNENKNENENEYISECGCSIARLKVIHQL